MQRVLAFPPSRGFGDPSEFVSKRMCFAFMFSLGFLAFLGGFLLGRFVFDKELERSRTKLKVAQSQKEQVFGVYKNYSQFNVSSIIEGLSESSIQKYFDLLTSQSSQESAFDNLREAEIFRSHLTSHGFDLVSPLVEIQMQLSYPSSKYPNQAQIINQADESVFEINDVREKDSETNGKEINTTVVESTVIYVNFGRNEDYQHLDFIGTYYMGKIFLMRAGRIPISEMVSNAVKHGAVGILIYLDPEQTNIELPLVSPIDLAKFEIRYGNHIDKWAGTVPILEISFKDASEIFQRMFIDKPVPSSWKGKLNAEYKISLFFIDKTWKMRLKVSTVNKMKTYYNTLGAMRGSQEPDRFVMLTNEKSLTHNEAKSASVIMEIIRVLGNLKRKGWRPHRSIVIAFWGVEGPNLHLSAHPESVLDQIIRKTVVYLNINSVDQMGNVWKRNMTQAKVTPILEKLFYQSAQAVSMNNTSADIMHPLNTDNLFIQCGVPFIMADNYNAKSIKDVVSFWGMVTWQAVESYKLPFSLNSYGRFFAHSIKVIENKFKTTSQEHSTFLDSLFQSVRQLITTIESFEAKWSRADTSKSIEMRIMTDQLLDFTRFLLCNSDSTTSSNNHSMGNLIFSKSLKEEDDKAGFGELQDLLQDMNLMENPQNIYKQIISHLDNLVESIDLARDTLSDGLEILVKGNT